MTDAEAFIERTETDEAFAKEIESLGANADAVIAKVQEAGYNVTPDEMREAFLERYGAELTPEQLEAVAAGASQDVIMGIAVVGASAAALAVGVSIAAAAAVN